VKIFLCAFLLLPLLALGGCAHRPMESPATTATPAVPPEVLAADALQRRDYREAARQYDALYRETPENRSVGLGLGEAWLGLGEAQPAFVVFEEVLARHPQDVDALEGVGLAHLGLQRYEQARETLQLVLAQRPGRWRALNGLGLIADMRANYPEAATWYMKALRARHDEPALYNNFGYSRLMAGDYAGAESMLAQAVRLSPGNLRLRNNLMQAVAWQGDYRRALSLRGEVPRHEALNNIGYVAWLRRDVASARRLFQQALDDSPSWYQAAASNLEQLEQEQENRQAGAP
jgi:Flp pilus assembly protein TadD